MVQRTTDIMNLVLLALLPGICTQLIFFGSGYLNNLIAAGLSGLTVCFALSVLQVSSGWNFPRLARDNGNWITCVLIAIALPPGISIWVVFIAVVTGLGLGKYAYGGTGQNIFNPAMVGYAFVLISFPAQLAIWPPLSDALTGATPLEIFKFRSGQTVDELWSTNHAFSILGGYGWEWINTAYLTGGLYLIYKKIISWHIPAGLLLALVLLSAANYDMGSSSSLGSPSMHLFTGATMLGAFFIATDPVTCPSGNQGKLFFGLMCGVLIFVIRSWGGYPDGMAFAVLIANMTSPMIDHVQSQYA